MKVFFLNILLLFSMNLFSQNENNSLLLLKIEKIQNLKIDKEKTIYLAIELDSSLIPLKNESSKLVYFSGFTDNQLLSCYKKDSIQLKTFLRSETFEQENRNGIKNEKLVNGNSNKMNKLMELNINSSLIYKQKVRISYTLINCNYCIGNIANYDGKFIGYKGKIALVIDNLKINNNYKIPKNNIYDIVKQINFNSFLY